MDEISNYELIEKIENIALLLLQVYSEEIHEELNKLKEEALKRMS